ncbi:MAG: hypothetical protein E7544_05865 [Ruminococcaceae bacterium]|nr:hypothetical protein [Oscillospiraceae bacterium]
MKSFFIKILSAISAFLMLFLSPGGHIRQPKLAEKCPAFYGNVATANPLEDKGNLPIPQHPFLAAEGTNGMHGNSYNTDTYDYMGPLGINPVVKSRSMNVFGGLVATLMFDSKGRIMCISGNVVGFRLLLIDADTLEILAETRLPQRASTVEAIKSFDFDKISSDTSGGAYCHLLEGDRPIIGNSDNVIQIFYIDESSGKPEWQIEKEWDISSYLPEGSYLTDAIPDYKGNIWFVTRPGEVGYIDAETEEVQLMKLEGEEIQNTLAICEDGIYIVSDTAMYRFDIGEDKIPHYTWRTAYDRGTTLKPGAINQGSGTTPTLLDVPVYDEEGEGAKQVGVRKLCAITDNADGRVNIVIYDRTTGEIVDQLPLFTEGKSVSENSIVAYGRSFIIENNYSESGAGFLVNDPTSEPGVTRIDMNFDCTEAFVVWESEEASATVVPKMSTENGILYLYTRVKNDDIPEKAVAWYLTAVDFRTGETLYKVFTGCGKNWNNSYGPITIGPNGKAYVGVFNGLISIEDTEK